MQARSDATAANAINAANNTHSNAADNQGGEHLRQLGSPILTAQLHRCYLSRGADLLEMLLENGINGLHPPSRNRQLPLTTHPMVQQKMTGVPRRVERRPSTCLQMVSSTAVPGLATRTAHTSPRPMPLLERCDSDNNPSSEGEGSFSFSFVTITIGMLVP